MNKYAIQHIPDSEYAYPLNENTLRLVLKTERGEKFKEVSVLWNNKYDFAKRRNFTRMRLLCHDAMYDYHVCDLTSGDARFAYIFLLTLPSDEEYYFSEEGLTGEYDFKHGYYTFFQFPFINAADVITTNPWAKDAVVYQIFIDRFCRGDSEKDDTYITKSWEQVPGSKDFAGGDLKGVTEKLDTIQDMGFNTLYLTPIFRSPSNHKYNVADYTKVDPMFGADEDLYDLIRATHARGMRVILDAVFNHCDESNPLFADVKEKGRASEFYDWFIVHGDFPEKYASSASSRHPERSEAQSKDPEDESGGLRTSGCFADATSPLVTPTPSASSRHPERSEAQSKDPEDESGGLRTSGCFAPLNMTQFCNYEIFADCPYMPKWNTSNPKVREYLIHIALTYLSWGVDGLRLDVADEVSHTLWRELKAAVRDKYPHALLIGEVWHENGMYLGGDEFDGVMNYKLQKVFADYFAGGLLTAQEAADKINRVIMCHRRQTNEMMLNFLDNHDTPRFLRLCGENEENLRAALVALYFSMGMPCVLYGTELPLTGDGDPDCRRTYDWAKKPRHALFLRELARTRKSLPDGEFYAKLEHGCLVLVRENETERVKAYFGRTKTRGDVIFEYENIRLVKESV